jgi:dipeptidyl aminopeptidase/acylaminoacyl peptidase
MNELPIRAFIILFAVLVAVCAHAAPKRPLEANDFDRMLAVGNPVCSRDGGWIAYTVEQPDLDADERRSSVWVVDFHGAQNMRLTGAAESADNPQFSPDGRFVSYLSAHGSEAKAQIYLVDRRGGEARVLTDVAGDIGGYAWSPDGTRLVISLSPGDGDPQNGAGAPAQGAKTPKPIVVDRVYFKEDQTGYVTAGDRAQLYLFDLTTKKLESLTTDVRFDDTSPIWSPDGHTIAFFSNHDTDPDVSGTLQLYLIDARSGAVAHKLADFFQPNETSLLFTRDGKRIVYSTGFDPKTNGYTQDRLAMIAAAGGKPKVLADRLDRALSFAVLTADDNAINAILEDDGSNIPATVPLDRNQVERRLGGKVSVTRQCSGNGHAAVLASTDSTAPEIYSLESNGLRKLTSHNDALMEELSLGSVEDISFPSRDGTTIHGMIVKPADFHTGRTYPTLLWIHGGPNLQDSHGLKFTTYAPTLDRQWFAAHGYVVLAVNYRGSSGRGAAFSSAIATDWGNKEVSDLLAGVDYVVNQKIADPQRLGIGGWSYGGSLTDYVIASDGRFKAAISGAGSGNSLAMYGSDEYILQYNAEMGPPWRTLDRWLRVSYPLLHADRIKTPTLFLGGEKDFNVPIVGSEQMYQALRTLGVPTQLVIYPGQFHELTRPSYIKDRRRRELGWFERYLAPGAN